MCFKIPSYIQFFAQVKSCIYIFHPFSLFRKGKHCSRFQYICSPFCICSVLLAYFHTFLMAFPLHTECLCTSHTLSCNSLPFLYIFLASIHSARSFTSSNDLLLQRWPFLSVYYVSPLFLFSAVGITASHSLFTLFFIFVFSFSLRTFLYLTLSLIFIRPLPTSTLSILRIPFSPLSLSWRRSIPAIFASPRAPQENGLSLINSLWGFLREPQRRRRRGGCKYETVT